MRSTSLVFYNNNRLQLKRKLRWPFLLCISKQQQQANVDGCKEWILYMINKSASREIIETHRPNWSPFSVRHQATAYTERAIRHPHLSQYGLVALQSGCFLPTLYTRREKKRWQSNADCSFFEHRNDGWVVMCEAGKDNVTFLTASKVITGILFWESLCSFLLVKNNVVIMYFMKC